MPNPSEQQLRAQLPAAPSAVRVASFQAGSPGSANKGEAPQAPQKPSQWIQGFAEGKAATEKELKASLQSAENALRKTCAEMQRRFEAEIKALEPQVVDLALAIAKSILGKEIERGNYDLPSIVATTIAGIRGEPGSLTVRLHPADHATMAQASNSGTNNPEIRFLADASVARASCAVETGYGKIVREVDSLLAEVERALGKSGAKTPGAAS